MVDKGFQQLVTIEVHQATGMVAMQLDCTPLEGTRANDRPRPYRPDHLGRTRGRRHRATDSVLVAGRYTPQLHRPTVGGMNGTPGNGARHLSARVLQAQGMVSAQRGCGMDEALARLRIRARASGQDLEELALDVLDGIIRFDP
jgi:hypothetical protein